MEDKSYIAFAGAVFSDVAVAKHFGLAASANYWRRGLIGGMEAAGAKVCAFGHRNEQLWPRGPILPNAKSVLDERFEGRLVTSLNFPYLKNRVLHRSYLKTFQRMIAEKGTPVALFTYNAYPYLSDTIRFAQKANIPWICITLDYDYGPDGWPQYAKQAGHADGHIILSYWAYEACPYPAPKLHLDGGFEEWFGRDISNPKENGRRAILYSGKYNEYGGLKVLLDTIDACVDLDVEFWLTGKCRSERVENLFDSRSNVKYFGFVDDARLHELSLQAFAFINPRTSEHLGNYGMFPSKLLRYLAYGKPVISTWTPGLSPEYKDVLNVVNDETPVAFKNEIQRVLNYSEEEFAQASLQIKSFLELNKSWKIQGMRIMDWVKSCNLIV